MSARWPGRVPRSSARGRESSSFPPPPPPADLRYLGDRGLGSRDGAARSFLPARLPVCAETPLRAPTFCARLPGGSSPGTRPRAAPATLRELGDRTLPKPGDPVAQNPGESRGSKGGRSPRRRAPRRASEPALRSRGTDARPSRKPRPAATHPTRSEAYTELLGPGPLVSRTWSHRPGFSEPNLQTLSVGKGSAQGAGSGSGIACP